MADEDSRKMSAPLCVGDAIVYHFQRVLLQPSNNGNKMAGIVLTFSLAVRMTIVLLCVAPLYFTGHGEFLVNNIDFIQKKENLNGRAKASKNTSIASASDFPIVKSVAPWPLLVMDDCAFLITVKDFNDRTLIWKLFDANIIRTFLYYILHFVVIYIYFQCAGLTIVCLFLKSIINLDSLIALLAILTHSLTVCGLALVLRFCFNNKSFVPEVLGSAAHIIFLFLFFSGFIGILSIIYEVSRSISWYLNLLMYGTTC
jgi:hypothetical protein